MSPSDPQLANLGQPIIRGSKGSVLGVRREERSRVRMEKFVVSQLKEQDSKYWEEDRREAGQCPCPWQAVSMQTANGK